MNRPASADGGPKSSRRRSDARWRTAWGLVTVVLAYLGIALGAAQLSPTASATGLSTTDAASHRPHLLLRDRGQTSVTLRSIDPPRADRPTAAVLGGSPQTFTTGRAAPGRAGSADVARATVPRAHLPRGPPQAVRSAAA